MTSLSPSVTLAALLAVSAPVPVRELPRDPDKAIEKFDKEVQDIQKCAQRRIEQQRKRLIEHLKGVHQTMVKEGRGEEATVLREQIRLLESSKEPALAVGLSVRNWKRASVEGKYRDLRRIIPVPADKQNHTEFCDYGMYNGTAYAGYNDLPAGYWVYVYPHWYIWGETNP
jgi:hypothetical protein